MYIAYDDISIYFRSDVYGMKSNGSSTERCGTPLIKFPILFTGEDFPVQLD